MRLTGNLPNLHRRRHNHHRPPHSHLHNLAKLIARDKAVSTFWNYTRKPSKRKVWACCLAVARIGSILVCPMLTSFSCRYSVSYDISISLLKTFLKTDCFVKISRGGGNPFYLHQENHGQSHMTISQLLGSTLRVLRSIPVPRQYPPSTPSGTSSTFLENLL
jgi:hypothetical protein